MIMTGVLMTLHGDDSECNYLKVRERRRSLRSHQMRRRKPRLLTPPDSPRLPQVTLISLPWLQHLAIFKVAQKTKSK